MATNVAQNRLSIPLSLVFVLLVACAAVVVLFAMGGSYAVTVALVAGCGTGLYAAGFVVEKFRWNSYPIVAGAFLGATTAVLGAFGTGQIPAERLNQRHEHWKFTPVEVRAARATVENSAMTGALLGIGVGFTVAWFSYRRFRRQQGTIANSERNRRSRIGRIFAVAAVLILLLAFAHWDSDRHRAIALFCMALVLVISSVAVWLTQNCMHGQHLYVLLSQAARTLHARKSKKFSVLQGFSWVVPSPSGSSRRDDA